MLSICQLGERSAEIARRRLSGVFLRRESDNADSDESCLQSLFDICRATDRIRPISMVFATSRAEPATASAEDIEAEKRQIGREVDGDRRENLSRQQASLDCLACP